MRDLDFDAAVGYTPEPPATLEALIKGWRVRAELHRLDKHHGLATGLEIAAEELERWIEAQAERRAAA